MRNLILAALLGLTLAQSNTPDADLCHSNHSCPSDGFGPTTVSSTSSQASRISSATTSSLNSAITVAADGSGQFTAINAAVSAAQISNVPTVTVLPGTYTEAVTILGTATVTIVGATASAAADWSQNQVTISYASTPFSIGTSNAKGVTVRNIHIINSATTPPSTVAAAVALRGNNIAFYGCSIISPGATVITASYGLAFFANSYIEGSDKLFYNVPTIYVYASTIVPLSSGASIVYNKGATISGTFYNSTVVLDSSSIQQKSGYTNTGVFLAAPNSAGAVAIFRNTAMGSLISAAGVHNSAASISSFYGEFGTSGPGSYTKNSAARASYDVPLTASQVSLFAIDKVYGNAFAPFGSPSLTWIDPSVLSALQSSNSAQLNLVSSSLSAVSSTSLASFTTSSNPAATGSTIFSSILSSTSVVSSNSASTNFATVSSTVLGSSIILSDLGLSATPTVSTTIAASSETLSNSVSLDSAIVSSSISPSSVATPSSTSTVSVTGSSMSPSSSCTAAVSSSTLTVSKNPGPCEYGDITSAIEALPNDSKPYTIQIGAGTYVEQISITRNGKVTLIGTTNFKNDYTQNSVRVEISRGELTSAGKNEETPVIYAKKTSDNSGLAVYNIDFVNTYPQTRDTAALAADFYGANIAAYGCSFIGFQDTLLANKGTQVFSNCYIEGSVDFIWGFSTAYFYQCMIVSNTPGSCIAAQSRSSADIAGGYVFDSCMVTYSSAYGSLYGQSFLGRPYSQFSIAVYMNSYIDKHIKDAGWSVWSKSNPQTSNVMFGEFNNSGPGSWQASTQRATFATQLTEAEAAKYKLAAWIGDTTWLDSAAYNSIPSYSLTGPATTTNSTNDTTTGSITTARINAHPDSGIIPPAGAVVVSVDGSHNAAFTTITAALASLPNDSTNQTIFLYPGIYNEQVPSIDRPGAVRIIGYTSGNPGQSYKDNQVTITYSRGLSISPQPVGHSNAETATVATGSSRISLYNINMINTDNLDGSQSSYVTLAASVYGNDIAFYACSFDGWQDTLLTGATAGYQYYESCYIGGAIDFIWGYSKAYFKGCTVGAKRKSSAITAQSRASSSAIGGYIFDQCLFTTAPGTTDDLTNKVYLGRPYSQYALVVIKNSHLDNTIIPSGWKIWSPTDPRTDHITFAEFNNSGPSNWENNAAARQAFGYATLLTSDTYSLASVMNSVEWIDMTYWNSIVTPQPTILVPLPTNTTVVGNSTFDGAAPPSGALIVSQNPIEGVSTYKTIQDALNAAPTSSKTNTTIFIYPGVYNEQLIVNKSGHTIFQGYSTATGDYSQNQVTIQFSRGSDTQGTTGSNTDGATVYATGNYFHAFNINFRNNNGTQQDIASLGFAVKSSKFAALYGCQIYGNQDTLSVSGSLFTFKTYIEGNVDFIYGSGSAYFLDSTISPNEDGVSITASKRTTNTTNAGFVFDQCKLRPATGTGPFSKIGLGRPWNNYARVVYVNNYLDSMVSAAGWNQWSKSTPNTNGVVYGEYRNYGPGSNNCNRASFSQQLSDTDVIQFQLGNFFPSTSFIDFSHVDTKPFSVGIGSAQTCASVSSSSSSSLTPLSSSSTTPSITLPIVTAYTTATLTAKLTTSTLITAPDITSTTVFRITETFSTTGSNVIKTSIQKVTATMSITLPDVTSTSTSTVTQDNGLTITPDPVTKTNVIERTITTDEVTTKAAATFTRKGSTTITVLHTTTPRPTTITRSEGSTVLITSSIRPREITTTVKTTISIEPSKTKTSTIKAKNTVTVSSVSYRTVTKKSTTTAFCIPTDPAQRMVRRGAVIPRAVAGTTTLTLSTTITSYVKTSTEIQAGSTAYTTQTLVAATKTTSIKGTTSTQTSTSIVGTATVTQDGSTHYTTLTTTRKIGKTTTLKPATITTVATSDVTKTSFSTVTADAVTISRVETKTATSIVAAEQQTAYTTKSADVTLTTKTTLPASTITKYQTSTKGAGVLTATVTAVPETKTVVRKSTRTVVQWATKTAKGAKACA